MLATTADLATLLGRDLSPTEEAQAEQMLAAASARVVAYTGQSFERSETTDRLRVRRGQVRLPQFPVVEVDSVEDVNGNAVSYQWHAGEIIELRLSPGFFFDREPWVSGLSWVDVTYTHGYETLPAEVVQVVLQMAARAMGIKADQSGYTSENIDGYSYGIGSAAASGAIGMLPDERATLDAYRRVGGSVSTPAVWVP